MKRKVLFTFAFAALAFAPSCASHGDSGAGADDGLLPGFHPPALTDGEIRVIAPTVVDIPGNSDVTWCDYIASPFATTLDVVESHGFQSQYGHHAILMEVAGAEDRLGQSHACTDQDMTDARFLAGGSDAAVAFTIPEGVGFRVEKASVLLVQSHWINTSGKTIQGQTVFDIRAVPPDPKRQTAQLFAAYTVNVSLPPRGTAHAHAECTVPQDLQFFAIGGHAHEFGQHVTLGVNRAGGATETVYDQDWRPSYQGAPPLNYYPVASPFMLHAGDTFTVDCDYMNSTDDPIKFPREMCVGEGFYFPGNVDIQCGDGHFSTSADTGSVQQ